MMQKVEIKYCVLTLRLYLIYGISGLSGGLGGFGIFIPEEFWKTKKSHLKAQLLLTDQDNYFNTLTKLGYSIVQNFMQVHSYVI